MSQWTRRQLLLTSAAGAVAAGLALPGRKSFAQDATPKRGGTVAIALAGAPASLDPHQNSSSYARDICLHMFEGLYARGEDGVPIPDLAEGCKISADGKTYTFALRSGVKFHNGKEMGPADVVASIERYRKVGISAKLIEGIDTVKATGPQEVTVTLKQNEATFLDALSTPRGPIAIFPEEEANKAPEQVQLIGTGPYKFVEYTPDSHVKLERFDGYSLNDAYKDRNGFAGRKEVFLDAITFRFMPDAAAQVAGLQAGEIQFIEDMNSSAVSQLDKAKFQVFKAIPFYLQVFKFNHAQSPTGDVNFRRAVEAALDMKQIMEISFPDINLVDGGWVFPNSPYATKAGLDLYNIHDLEKAKEHLAKSSYKGEKLTFIIDDYRPDVDTATNIQEQLAQIGINIDVRVSDWATVEKLGFTPDGWHFWAHGVGIEPYQGPASVMAIWAGGKSQIKVDPVIDELYARYTTELDDAKRKQIFADFQKHMYEDAVGLQLGNYGLFQAAPVNLTNFVPYRIPRMWGVWLA